MGFRFDTVISSYILALPFLLLFLNSFLKRDWIKKIILIWIVLFFSIAFIVAAADIPFFIQFYMRFNVLAFQWLDNVSFVLKMIFQEPRYFLISIPLVIVLIYFNKYVFSLYKQYQIYGQEKKIKIYLKFFYFVVFGGLIFLGMRGRIEKKSPIRIGTAYFCNDNFLNQLGLNANYTLLYSFIESTKKENKLIHLMPDDKAITLTKKYLNVLKDTLSPIGRFEKSSDSISNKYNVVIIIMESMSAEKMSRHGNPNNLTPFLDSISNLGYYFENTYSSGIHTFNGIYSVLTSFPSLFLHHPMKQLTNQPYRGLYYTLKKFGYSTLFFTTHDAQFDNIEGFVRNNGCDEVISQKHYPSDMIKTTLGVPDDVMFRFSIPILNKYAENKNPFVAVFLTASDHGPYYIPDYFHPRSKSKEMQAVEYADYSLRVFINEAQKQEWFSNTLFVFVADHGSALETTYSITLSYHHIPFLIFNPNIIKQPKIFSNMVGQIDVFPTIMDILQLSYVNTTLGLSALSYKRPCIYFTSDDKYGVINDSLFLILQPSLKTKNLYKYKNKDLKDYSFAYPYIFSLMEEYANAQLQTTQYLLKYNLQ